MFTHRLRYLENCVLSAHPLILLKNKEKSVADGLAEEVFVALRTPFPSDRDAVPLCEGRPFSFLRKSVFSRSALRQHRSYCRITSITSGKMQNQFLLSLWQHPEKIKTFCRGFESQNCPEVRLRKNGQKPREAVVTLQHILADAPPTDAGQTI